MWELQYSRISNKKYNLNTWGVKKQKILNTLEQVPDKSNLIDKKLNNYGMLQSHNTTKWGQHIKQTQKYNTILKKLRVESITENNIKGFQKNKLKIEKLNKIYKKNELLWNNRVLTCLSTKFTKIDRKQTNFDKFLYIIKTNTYSHLENTKIKINNANIKIDSVKKTNEIFIIKSWGLFHERFKKIVNSTYDNFTLEKMKERQKIYRITTKEIEKKEHIDDKDMRLHKKINLKEGGAVKIKFRTKFRTDVKYIYETYNLRGVNSYFNMNQNYIDEIKNTNNKNNQIFNQTKTKNNENSKIQILGRILLVNSDFFKEIEVKNKNLKQTNSNNLSEIISVNLHNKNFYIQKLKNWKIENNYIKTPILKKLQYLGRNNKMDGILYLKKIKLGQFLINSVDFKKSKQYLKNYTPIFNKLANFKGENYAENIINEINLISRLGVREQLSWITKVRKKKLLNNLNFFLEKIVNKKIQDPNQINILTKSLEINQLLLQKYYEMLQENLNKKQNFNLYLRDFVENNSKLVEFINKKEQQNAEQIVDISGNKLNTKIEKQGIDKLYLNLKKSNQRYKEIRRRNIYQNYKIKRFTNQKLQMLKRKTNAAYGIPESSELILSNYENKLKFWNASVDFEKKLFKRLNTNFKDVIELNLINSALANTELNKLSGLGMPTNKLTLFAKYLNAEIFEEEKQSNVAVKEIGDLKQNIQKYWEKKYINKQYEKKYLKLQNIKLHGVFEQYVKTFLNIQQRKIEKNNKLDIEEAGFNTNSEILGIVWEFWKTKKRIVELEKLETILFLKKNLKINQQNTIWLDEQTKAFSKLHKIKERFNTIVNSSKHKLNSLTLFEESNNLGLSEEQRQLVIRTQANQLNLDLIKKKLKVFGVLTENLLNYKSNIDKSTELILKINQLKKLKNAPIWQNPILGELILEEDDEYLVENQNKNINVKPNSWLVDYMDTNRDLMNFLNIWELKKTKRRSFWYRYGDTSTKERLHIREAFKAWKLNNFRRKIEIFGLGEGNSFKGRWVEYNKNIIDNFRQTNKQKKILDNPKLNRNFGRLFRKLNKDLSVYQTEKYIGNKKKLLEKNLDEEKNTIEKLEELRELGKVDLIKTQNLYKQLQKENDIPTLTLHYNLLRKKTSMLAKNSIYVHADRERKLNLLQKVYNIGEELEDEDLGHQSGLADINRWGVQAGRGGFDWYWLRLNHTEKLNDAEKKKTIRNFFEKKRFEDIWQSPEELLKKYLKYSTINQYTLRVIRSKYFAKQLATDDIYYGKGNSLPILKKILKDSYYAVGNTGPKFHISGGVSDKYFNNWLYKNIIDRIKQPLRVDKVNRQPFLRYNYNILHQKVLTLYQNYKRKYDKLRHLVKPLQFYFRDYLRYNLDLRDINYMGRNDINLINANIHSKHVEKKKLTQVKKLLLNSRIMYEKDVNVWEKEKLSNSENIGKVGTEIFKSFFGEALKNTLTIEQLKKILKWELAWLELTGDDILAKSEKEWLITDVSQKKRKILESEIIEKKISKNSEKHMESLEYLNNLSEVYSGKNNPEILENVTKKKEIVINKLLTLANTAEIEPILREQEINIPEELKTVDLKQGLKSDIENVAITYRYVYKKYVEDLFGIELKIEDFNNDIWHEIIKLSNENKENKKENKTVLGFGVNNYKVAKFQTNKLKALAVLSLSDDSLAAYCELKDSGEYFGNSLLGEASITEPFDYEEADELITDEHNYNIYTGNSAYFGVVNDEDDKSKLRKNWKKNINAMRKKKRESLTRGSMDELGTKYAFDKFNLLSTTYYAAMLEGLSKNEEGKSLKVAKSVYSNFGKDSGVFNYLSSSENLGLKIQSFKSNKLIKTNLSNTINTLRLDAETFNRLFENIVNFQDKNYYSLIRFLRNRGNQLTYLQGIDTLSEKFPEIVIKQKQNFAITDQINLANYTILSENPYMGKILTSTNYLPRLTYGQKEKKI